MSVAFRGRKAINDNNAAIRKREFLETTFCPLCHHIYGVTTNEPLILPCGHNLCQACERKMTTRNSSLICPKCYFKHNGHKRSVDVGLLKKSIKSHTEYRPKKDKRLEHDEYTKQFLRNFTVNGDDEFDGKRKKDTKVFNSFEEFLQNVTAIKHGLKYLSMNELMYFKRPAYIYNQTKTGPKYGKIIKIDDYLFLHSLKSNIPCESPIVVPLLEMMNNIPPIENVFLYVYHGDQPRGYVIIKLEGKTLFRKKFLQFCIGQNGTSYRNTIFYKIEPIGVEGESIYGGDFEHNNGTGSKSDNINHGVHVSQRIVGLVEADECRFKIVLKSSPGITTKAVGKVFDGIRHLLPGSKGLYEKTLYVRDSGIVLPALPKLSK